MGRADGRCIVCGNGPTVKSHLFPRALMLDMKRDARTLVESSHHRAGYVERQNGPWDDRFLCKTHEDMAGGGDDYVVRLSRRLPGDATVHPKGGALQIDNPEPSLLMRFIYGTIWRHVVAPSTVGDGRRLGPYRRRFEAALFHGGPFHLPALASISNLRGSDGKRVPCGLSPYRNKVGDRAIWHFVVGHLDFMLKTDNQDWPAAWSEMFADRDPLVLFQADAVDIATVPLLRHLTDNIRASPLRGRSRIP